MTEVGVDDWGQPIYSAEIPANVKGICFNNGSSLTVDITEGIVNGSAWYPSDETDDSGHYRVRTFTYTPDPEWTSGNCTVTYADGVLTISGTGAMANYDDASNRPWNTYASDITSISIGEGVTSIGANAFEGCNNASLSSITIPSSVTSIGWSAFYSCTNLSSITIPSSVKNIGTYAFWGCSSLASVNIPSSVTSIGSCVFYNCTNLTSITIPNSVTSIGANAFKGCSSLATITFADGSQLESVGNGAFYGTAWYNNQPNGLVYAGKVAYKYKGTMPKNTSITLVDGTKGITDFAFANFSNLASITIPNSVTNIGWSAFYSCTNLSSITIPSSVTSIGANAFYGCSSLASVTIWAPSLNSYGNSAFGNCNTLTKFYVPTEAAVTTYSINWSECSGLIVAIPNTLTAHSADDAYWCTYYNGYSNADVDANTKVYTVSVSGTNAILNEIADGNIKAGQGVVLKSTTSPITLTYNTDETTGDFSTNVLEGVDAATACEANANYTLAGDEGLGFYKYTGTTLAANKAYLPASAVTSSAREFYLFSFEDEMTTGVADVRGKKEDVRSGEYFNLNGQRISKPTKKGLYIVGGRKFLKN